MILNSGEFGILAFNATINAYNTVLADCAYPALIIEMGGTYNFYHCTISNVSAYYPESYEIYKPRSESLPSVFFTNYVDWIDLDNDYRIEEVTYPKDIRLHFYNSIIYGNQNNEIYYVPFRWQVWITVLTTAC
jgi:hypothetical protein